MIPFNLTILGTSSALPTSKRYPTAQVLNIRERFFLIDCGEGTQIQLRKYSIKFTRINHIFISHLHGDHYFGLIGLLSTYALIGRSNDLHIYSHSELPDLLKPQLDYLNTEVLYKIIWHPLNFKRAQTVFEDEAITVSSFPVKHRVPCCGFKFSEKEHPRNIIKEKIQEFKIPLREIPSIKSGSDFITEEGGVIINRDITTPGKKARSYAFCTDTIYLPKLSEFFRGVDLLYHEATYDKTLIKRAGETYHSTAEQAATIAKNSDVGKLIIGHFSARYKDCNLLLEEAREIFVNSIVAEEGLVVEIIH